MFKKKIIKDDTKEEIYIDDKEGIGILNQHFYKNILEKIKKYNSKKIDISVASYLFPFKKYGIKVECKRPDIRESIYNEITNQLYWNDYIYKRMNELTKDRSSEGVSFGVNLNELNAFYMTIIKKGRDSLIITPSNTYSLYYKEQENKEHIKRFNSNLLKIVYNVLEPYKDIPKEIELKTKLLPLLF